MSINKIKISCLIFIILAQIVAVKSAFACSTDEQSLAKAQQIWEQAVAAKGGRERILNIKSFLSYDKNLDFVGLRVFPDKTWNWSNNGKPIGLTVTSENYSKEISYRIMKGAEPFSFKPSTKMEWGLASMLDLLLETKWIKPEILGSDTTEINGRKFDVVCTEVANYRVVKTNFIFDPETHLLARTLRYYTKSPGDGFYTTDYSDYVAIKGIMFPQKEIRKPSDQKGRLIDNFKVDIDVDYREDLFDKPPSIEDGPNGWKRIR